LLVIGSRGSKLALWQSNHILACLESLGHSCRLEVITTTGDRFQTGPLKEVGNKGLFTKEIEEALLDGRIDVAVHSLKDMPTLVPEGLQITATPPREDVRDAIIGSTLQALGPGSKVGTGSLRRIAQIYATRPDLVVEPVRGNVDTRLRKLDEGQFQAIVLAAAGLRRLGWASRIAEYIPVEVMCPAVGQGALAIETRADNGPGMQACSALNDADTFSAITAERALLTVLGGGCQVPVGAYASISSGRLQLRAIVSAPDGKTLVRREAEGAVEDAEGIGMALGSELLDAGAREILAVVYGHAG
jgi:hydroxymethylbilane synthase